MIEFLIKNRSTVVSPHDRLINYRFAERKYNSLWFTVDKMRIVRLQDFSVRIWDLRIQGDWMEARTEVK